MNLYHSLPNKLPPSPTGSPPPAFPPHLHGCAGLLFLQRAPLPFQSWSILLHCQSKAVPNNREPSWDRQRAAGSRITIIIQLCSPGPRGRQHIRQASCPGCVTCPSTCGRHRKGLLPERLALWLLTAASTHPYPQLECPLPWGFHRDVRYSEGPSVERNGTTDSWPHSTALWMEQGHPALPQPIPRNWSTEKSNSKSRPLVFESLATHWQPVWGRFCWPFWFLQHPRVMSKATSQTLVQGSPPKGQSSCLSLQLYRSPCLTLLCPLNKGDV